jgi:Protein of unknown function (DUF3500)
VAQQFERLVVAAETQTIWMKWYRCRNDWNLALPWRHVFEGDAQCPGKGRSERRAEIATCAVFQAKDGLFHRATVSHGGGCTDQMEWLAGAVCTGAFVQRHRAPRAGFINRIDAWLAFGAKNVGRTRNVGALSRCRQNVAPWATGRPDKLNEGAERASNHGVVVVHRNAGLTENCNSAKATHMSIASRLSKLLVPSLLPLAVLGIFLSTPSLDAALTSASSLARTANAFLAGLNEAQRAQAARPFDGKLREDWHFIPKAREGAVWKEMTPAQRKLGTALLKTALSSAGHTKMTRVMSLESVLADLEKDPVKRDAEKYYFLIFGSPSDRPDAAPWGFRYEGHHVSLSFTVVGGKLVATTPSFLGANPANVKEGKHKGTRVLGAEEDLGRKLVKTFVGDAAKAVVYDAAAPDDILTLALPLAQPLEKRGVNYGSMTVAQKRLVDQLLRDYANLMVPALAAERLARVDRAGRDNVYFAWAGGVAPGERHYYRLQGPTFVVEYDNTQNGANHVHTAWRDFDGDFGRDLLREHLKADHAK